MQVFSSFFFFFQILCIPGDCLNSRSDVIKKNEHLVPKMCSVFVACLVISCPLVACKLIKESGCNWWCNALQSAKMPICCTLTCFGLTASCLPSLGKVCSWMAECHIACTKRASSVTIIQQTKVFQEKHFLKAYVQLCLKMKKIWGKGFSWIFFFLKYHQVKYDRKVYF